MIVSNGSGTIAQRAAKLQLRTWLIWVAVAAVTLIVIQTLMSCGLHVHVWWGTAEGVHGTDTGTEIKYSLRGFASPRQMHTHSKEGTASEELKSSAEERREGVFPPGNADRGCLANRTLAPGHLAAVVLVTFDRPEYLQRAVDSLLKVHRKDSSYKMKFPLYISQDGTHDEVHSLATSFVPEVKYMNHVEDAVPKMARASENVAYYRISDHYKFILMQIFDCFQYEKIIFLEDDMILAPDFFSYFGATAKLLDQDSSLWCVSSWNDHGMKQYVSNATNLVRSDFFPGWGWMTSRGIWDSFKAEWPAAYWDDWMRESTVRAGRQCIRPEICRTYNIGAKGTSNGLFYKEYNLDIKLNNVDINWSKLDLSYLQQPRYDVAWNNTLTSAKTLTAISEVEQAKGDVKILYESIQKYEEIAGYFKILPEWKDGIPRGSYQMTVPISLKGGKVRVFITPQPGVSFSATGG